MEQFKIIEPINCGRYGGVYKARDKVNNIVAVKKLPLFRHDLNHFENAQMIQRESTNWKKISGKNNIIPLVDFITNNEEAWFISEYCPHGSLNDNIHKLYNNEREIQHVIKNIITGINNCHNENIAHCDIKPANILLADNYEWKLCDFGCSQASEFDYTGLFMKRGTPLFVAPELFGFDGYGKNADIWAIGIIAYMLTNNGEYPFIWDADFKAHIMDGKFTWSNTNVSKELKDLVNLCLNTNCKKRISSREALDHSYFK